jgi:hypothetical protein
MTKSGIQKKSDFLVYQDDNGVAKVNVRFEGEDIWLSQFQLAEIFETSVPNVNMHIKEITNSGELEANRTIKDFLIVRQEGKRFVKRNIEHYNLDMIIGLGYRINSQPATRFRQWATNRLHEYVQKGFTLDDERLKGNRNRYFKELLQRIRDIRTSERNMYQQVTDIFATAIDYSSSDNLTREFFATIQNKLHWAAHQHTAAELIFERVDALKPMVGMTNFKGDYITKEDVQIAKNYLTEKELRYLNLLVSQFFDYAELQALEENQMTRKAWIGKLDELMTLSGRELLEGKGTISHKDASKKAIKELEIYRRKEMLEYESDFDRAMRELSNIDNNYT